jgi:hypothetical protein
MSATEKTPNPQVRLDPRVRYIAGVLAAIQKLGLSAYIESRLEQVMREEWRKVFSDKPYGEPGLDPPPEPSNGDGTHRQGKRR